MDKEELLKGFGEKLGEQPNAEGIYEKSGISTRTLDTYVGEILPEVGEEVNDGFYEKHIRILNSIGGQMRKEKADLFKSLKSTTKTDPEPKQEPNNGGNDGIQAILGKLDEITKANNSLKERLDQQERQRSVSEITRQLNGALKEKYQNFNQDVFEIAIKEISVDTEKSVESQADELTKAYEAWNKRLYGNGPSPRLGGREQTKQVGDALAELKAKHQKEGRLPNNN